MGWLIKCADASCRRKTRAGNIVDLIASNRDANGWLRCQSCGRPGYIEKRFELQEKGEVWKPYLRGIIPLGDPGDTYQPFVFLVSDSESGEVDSVWFSYYKDLRATGGNLKLGYGPGGPPVLHKTAILNLLRHLVERQFVTRAEIANALGEETG
ncbi:MAG: hypothetical protein ACLQPN_11110 [Bryobacteraceae bacterium]